MTSEPDPNAADTEDHPLRPDDDDSDLRYDHRTEPDDEPERDPDG